MLKKHQTLCDDISAFKKRIETSRAGLANPEKPIGVFMLCGPSGVGKTETALALAETLYGGEQNIITINMSEFQEAITHLQEMEEDLVDTHHNVIQTMQNWVQEDSQLISMTQEVDYDQDGNKDTG